MNTEVPTSSSPKTETEARKLAALAESLSHGESHSTTQLLVLKSLCKDASVAQRFAVHILRRAFPDPIHISPGPDQWEVQRGVDTIFALASGASPPNRSDLLKILDHIQDFQNEHRQGSRGAVRLIKSNRLLMVEFALKTFIEPDAAAEWAYELALRYAERYDSKHGSGLLPASATYVRDIASFWHENSAAPDLKPENESTKSRMPSAKQGQYLAYIHHYTKLHRCPPAMSDLQAFFRVEAPTVHQMVLRLEKLGFLARIPFQARSLRVLLPPGEIPPLK